MKNIFNKILMLACLTGAGQGFAEDIDLFVGPALTTGPQSPNVLFVIDNTANWNTPFAAEQAALISVFGSIKNRVISDGLGINIGIMLYSETGSPNSAISGGYVRAAIRPMGEPTGTGTDLYADLYSDLIDGLSKNGDKANGGDAGLSMAEAYLYFSGKAPYAGTSKAKTDYDANTFNTGNCCGASMAVWALPDNALDSFSSDPLYNSPIRTGSCGKNYIIYISNGAAQDSSSGSQISNTMLAALGGDTTQIGLNPSGSQTTTMDEWARFMKHDSPEEITTFTVDVLPRTTGQGPGWTRLLKSVADESGGVAYTVSNSGQIAAGLVGALNDALDRILAVNSVFASVALPASANAQSTFLNQVYIGQFRPDKDAFARWPGNLKQYKLGRDTNDNNALKLLDADGDPVVDNTDNAIIEKCANSFWSSTDSYWSGDLDLDLDSGLVCMEGGVDSTASNSPDGQHVEKGGQGQMLRGITPASRTVYTCSDTLATCSSTSALPSFNTANSAITDTLLGVASGDRNDTINWGRGADIDDEDGNGVPTDMRASVHGDVVHSRPVAINYGTDANPKIVVFYSGNDGMLRAINGNRPDKSGIVNVTGTTPGQEVWSFMPPEFYPSIDTLRQNVDFVNYPASTSTAPTGGISKPYGIDGPLTAFEGWVPDAAANKKYLFAGMRRAGRVVYAFDVTSDTTPAMLWKKGCPNLANDTGCTPTGTNEWEKIGQTWSQPTLLYANGYTDGTDPKPMLIMGGGYDACEDTDNNSTENNSCSSGTKGDVIYVLDAYNGNVLKSFTTTRAVPGAITVVPYGDGIDTGIKFAYATDAGGNIYRIHGGTTAAPTAIGTTAPGSWVMTKIASLGCATDASCTANRKFLFGPDVLRVPNTTDVLAILVGSGDREKPLEAYGAANSVQNYFFTVFDKPTVATWLTDQTSGTCTSGSILCLNSLTSVTTSGPASGVTLSPKGWRMPLAAGEQVVTGAITVSNVANFSTHIPAAPSQACANKTGTATSYNLSYRDGEGDANEIPGGGLIPTPVAGIVILDDGERVPMCIGCGGEDSAIGVKLVGSGITWTQPKSRVYWKIQQ